MVTGVDASESMLAIARKRVAEAGLPVHLDIGDAHALRFADRSFDVAVSLRLLMHARDWRTCLSELCRVADRLVVLDYPSAASTAALHAVGRRLLSSVGARAEPYRVFSDRTIAAALAAAGFAVRSTHKQFVLPIAFHKVVGSRRFTLGSEALLRRAGLVGLVGSPVTVVAERCTRS
jgi:ubiquinone/menaquinone biosynthesis C-methylase UbiE